VKIIASVLWTLGIVAGCCFAQNVNFTITVNGQRQPISPYIYGSNQVLAADDNYSVMRQGGNRMTGYNWENNASNAGNDYLMSSDNYLTWSAGIAFENSPGIVTTFFHDNNQKRGTPYSLVTVQLAGYAAKDKNGTVTVNQTAPSARWVRVSPAKLRPFALTPDVSDTNVFIDEYVNFLVTKYGKANSSTGIKGYSLDNEPALWPSTHPRIHPNQTTCQEIVAKAIEYSTAVKNVDEFGEIFGPALYGFSAYTTFQNAPDWAGVKLRTTYTWFIDYYLDKLKAAETSSGRRLLDVLDVHWYPEATGDHRIVDAGATTAADVAARLQAPRTLWDQTYTEKSWIMQSPSNRAFFPLIPKLQSSIDTYYPGTKLAFTEFDYGGPNHISGGIAVADVLGIFAKYGVYMGCLWPESAAASYQSAAYKLYRNYDGKKSMFGDLYVPSVTNDSVNTSVYASIKNGSNEIHLIVLNKFLTKAVNGNFSIRADNTIQSGRVWGFDSTSSVCKELPPVATIQNNAFAYTLPAGSACHFVLVTNSTATDAEKISVPSGFTIALDVYPNPFNPACTIVYSLPVDAEGRLELFSLDGKRVKTFYNLPRSGRLRWNGETDNYQQTASGMYCLVLRNSSKIFTTKKILLLK
jgi:mannan endo-1,4-beta-mannosidase